MALQSYPRTRLVCSVEYPKINTTVHHYQILSSAVYLNDPPRRHCNNSTNMRPSSRPKESITLATAASAGRRPAQAQSRLPSLEPNTDTDVAIQAFLDSLLVKYLQQEQKKKEQDALVATTIVEAAEENSSVNTFTPTIFVTDLIPAPPLPDDNTRNSLSKLFQEQQKGRLAKFMAKMACHLLYSDHNQPELLKPTQELMEYCAYFMDTVVANAIVMDHTEVSILDDLKAEDPELKAYPTLKATLDNAEKSAGTSTPSPAVVMMALKYIHDVVKALKDRNQGAGVENSTAALIITAAMCLAHKSLDEFTCSFSSTPIWAKISGFDMKNVEATERDMLEALEYRIYTSPVRYSEWLDYLVELADRHMPEDRFVPVEFQTLAEMSTIESLYSTTLGYVPPALKTYTEDLLDLMPPFTLQNRGPIQTLKGSYSGITIHLSEGPNQGRTPGVDLSDGFSETSMSSATEAQAGAASGSGADVGCTVEAEGTEEVPTGPAAEPILSSSIDSTHPSQPTSSSAGRTRRVTIPRASTTPTFIQSGPPVDFAETKNQRATARMELEQGSLGLSASKWRSSSSRRDCPIHIHQPQHHQPQHQQESPSRHQKAPFQSADSGRSTILDSSLTAKNVSSSRFKFSSIHTASSRTRRWVPATPMIFNF